MFLGANDKMVVLMADEVYYDFGSGHLIVHQDSTAHKPRCEWRIKMTHEHAKQILAELCMLGHCNLSAYSAELCA